jgi:hypothetical protein
MTPKPLALLPLAFLVALGCGGDNLGRQAVSGAVNVDGTPLVKGSIRFQPVEKGIGSGAKIEAGKYAIARKDGLPPGSYRVLINAPVPGTEPTADSAPPGDPLPVPKELIPEDWNEKSEHTVEIKNGKNEHNFDVQTKKK